jgi:cytochrome c biogenesis factor
MPSDQKQTIRLIRHQNITLITKKHQQEQQHAFWVTGTSESGSCGSVGWKTALASYPFFVLVFVVVVVVIVVVIVFVVVCCCCRRRRLCRLRLVVVVIIVVIIKLYHLAVVVVADQTKKIKERTQT